MILVLSLTIFAWCILGVVSVVSASKEEHREDCRSGRNIFYFLALGTFLQLCFCNAGSTADTNTPHAFRSSPQQLQQEGEQHQQRQQSEDAESVTIEVMV